MAKPILQTKPSTRSLWAVATAAFLIFCVLWTFNNPVWPSFSTILSEPNTKNCLQGGLPLNTSQEPTDKTFYDDPKTYYTIDKPMINWDEKRTEWLKHHPTFTSTTKNRILVVTGSQPSPCKYPLGDHLLLRFFKNKVDYCRIHGYDIFYNNAFLDPKMRSFWAKIPILKAAMLAHPEAEWLFWVDSDAMFTDMEFKVPLERYKDHNLVVHGWPNLIYEKKSWVAVNAGVFLIRNCQWSMDFLDVWGNMGPKSPDYPKWGRILRSTLKDKMFPESDDQSALIYLLLKEKKKWGDMIYVENEYSLHGYWLEIVKKFDYIANKYLGIEKRVPRLRRRRAEAVSESYAAEREGYVAEGGDRRGGWRRPFVTHFTGCQPCSGDHNPAYEGDSCWVGMERALNFADNQVLRNYGFVHLDPGNGSHVRPLPFDYPGDESHEFV
ncbi:Subunit of Golgi mannosyltransferase complex [Handroanthus impetiginosus]|uniref:Subunit of Golgi mannosyltransferase complex n=1 Tax=Handroanthus impetiginosus TaxID=429701 RepID=A0A2G9HHD7_9LAMI|nr:Subunit of Golgi mannosyltransferase complex [Handroanthus impetiginosus]PIN16924.1 Subunit of Golgi mannosyltransferase complex [Handroanthus impetiginosus]